MGEKKKQGLVVISFILALIGLGVGGYSFYIIQFTDFQGTNGIDGTDGTDGINGTNGIDGENGNSPVGEPIFICSSQSEIEAALDAIGSDSGSIILNGTITLTSAIAINQSGNYKILGGLGNKLIQSAAESHFDITNASAIWIDGINLYFLSSSLTYIKMIPVTDDVENCVIQNCLLQSEPNTVVEAGIHIEVEKVKVLNNRFVNLFSGVYSNGDYLICNQNSFLNMTENAINLDADYCFCKYNYLEQISTVGIIIYGDYNEILNNIIIGETVVKSSDIHGLYVYSGATYLLIDGNIIKDFQNTDTGDGIGMEVFGTDRVMTISNNLASNNDVDINSPAAPTLINYIGNSFPSP